MGSGFDFSGLDFSGLDFSGSGMPDIPLPLLMKFLKMLKVIGHIKENKPDFSGRPDFDGKPDFSGRPDFSGKPDFGGKPDFDGKPDFGGKRPRSQNELRDELIALLTKN